VAVFCIVEENAFGVVQLIMHWIGVEKRNVQLLFLLLLTTASFASSSTRGVTAFVSDGLKRTTPVVNRFIRTIPSRPAVSSQRQIIQPLNWKLNSDDGNDEEAAIIEDARLKVLQSRRKQVRQTLQAAEKLRLYRIQNGFIPEIDPATGKPIQDGKLAVTFTAYVVTVGALVLRIGGRAALISAIGLDFLSDSPELKENLELVLTTAETMDPLTKVLLFTAAWTAVKVLCFDAGGVVLALASGIVFGGVIPGALASATAATLGSTVAFSLAQADTPVRQKALSLLEEYPSLRGIERVVARDGIKAVLTLRLAPVLPIPIGMYSYIYGVTNVPLLDFMSGIFLGSLKPYLLDSYLGYFGKEIVQGLDPSDGGLQDYLLLGALGVSILIGVFASQLASETWDSVIQEVESEKEAKKALLPGEDDAEENDGVVRTVLGVTVPEWLVGFQLGLKAANERISDLIIEEYAAKVWNHTSSAEPLLPALDPAQYPHSPERLYVNQGLDFGQDLCNGIVLSPLLFTAFLKYADPLYDESMDELLKDHTFGRTLQSTADGAIPTSLTSVTKAFQPGLKQQREELLNQLQTLRSLTERRISELDEQVRQSQSNNPPPS
jgi:uncharacterized membrane protein YdjX (TVP38/TMEM64 family)